MNKTNTAMPRRGIYLLPNLFTTAALFSGFYAIISAMNGRYEAAAMAIFASLILDGVDGRVARLTNTQSAFGAEYDSMADMVSFAAAPALVMYLWALQPLGKLGLFAAFVHMAGGALRLARFNTQLATSDKRYFQGLPSPSAASILAGFLWLNLEYGIAGKSLALLVAPLTVMTGLLMVSNFRYYSFKDSELKGRVRFVTLIGMMLSLAAVFAKPEIMLFLVSFSYAVSGPVVTLVMRRRRRQPKAV